MKKSLLLKLVLLTVSVLMLNSCSPAGFMGSSTGEASDTPAVTGEPTPSDTESERPTPTAENIYLHTPNADYPVYAETYLNALPSRDFDGSSFFVVSNDISLYNSEEISYLSDSVYRRNKLIEKKYNISVRSTKYPVKILLERLETTVATGEYLTDIIDIPQENIGSFVAVGLLMNMRSLPFLDTSMPYFNQSSVKAFGAGNNLYAIAGEATPASEHLPAVIFNKAHLTGISEDELYSLALSEQFTWDKFHELAVAADAAEGVAGGVCAGDDIIDALFISFGQHYTSNEIKKTPTVSVSLNSMDFPATYYRGILGMTASENTDSSSPAEFFSRGSALFTVAYISELDSYRSSSIVTGILPIPKASADEEIYSLASRKAPVLCVPKGTTDSELVSLMISALNASSYGSLGESYVNYLHAVTLPDNRSADVLELITRTAVYELPYMHSLTNEIIYNGTVGLVRDIITTGDFTNFHTAVNSAATELARIYK